MAWKTLEAPQSLTWKDRNTCYDMSSIMFSKRAENTTKMYENPWAKHSRESEIKLQNILHRVYLPCPYTTHAHLLTHRCKTRAKTMVAYLWLQQMLISTVCSTNNTPAARVTQDNTWPLVPTCCTALRVNARLLHGLRLSHTAALSHTPASPSTCCCDGEQHWYCQVDKSLCIIYNQARVGNVHAALKRTVKGKEPRDLFTQEGDTGVVSLCWSVQTFVQCCSSSAVYLGWLTQLCFDAQSYIMESIKSRCSEQPYWVYYCEVRF